MNQENIELRGCTIELRSADGDLYYKPHSINSIFSESFIVAPYDSTYIIYIRCNDYKPFKLVVEYGKFDNNKPIELGDIKMELKD